MIRCFLPRLFVIVLVFVAPSYGQIRDRSHRRIISASSILTTQWGHWNGHTGIANSTLGDDVYRAEGQFPGVMAADFVYSADVTLQENDTEAHLQFRISNEGRYGVAIGTRGVRVYKQVRQANPFIDSPRIDSVKMAERADQLAFHVLAYTTKPLATGVSRTVKVIASGPSLTFNVDGVDVSVVTDATIGVGRFGLYINGNKDASAIFSNVTVDAMVTAASNFALLYNTLGYEAAGPKRALVRTLAELPEAWVKEASFVVTPELEHTAVARGSLKDTHVRSLGMSTWAADFDDVKEPGRYVLKVTMEGHDARLSGRYFKHRLVSAPFEIGTRLITGRMLKPLALLNPEARRAADDDMASHWEVHSGQFRATEDGIITAIGLHGIGGVLARKGDGYNGGAPSAETFTLSGDIAIDSGCDAQLQFQITPEERFGVTLQAGSAGGCVRGGPGAVSLHSERPRTDENPAGTYHELERWELPRPFEIGRFYRIVVNVAEDAIDRRNYADVDVDDVRMLSHVPVGERAGTFALKVWGSTARFDHVIAWQPGLTFVTRGGVRIPVMNVNGSTITCEEGERIVNEVPILHPDLRKPICYPLFAQRHGFHDCNNYIGEATSHGTFLAGLMDVWTRRRADLDAHDRIMFHRAVVATAGYLEELQRAAGYTGEYAHEEPSRGARQGARWYYQVWFGLYGDAALAAKGADLDDPALARKACIRASRTVTWLIAEESRAANNQATRFAPAGSGPFKAWPDSLKALVYAQLAQCASREGDAVLPPLPVTVLKSEAIRTAGEWLELLNADPGAQSRESNRGIPWLAGVDEVLRFGPDADLVANLQKLALNLGNGEKEGFQIFPAGTSAHWEHRSGVPGNSGPLMPLPGTKPELTWYIIPHFAMSSIDASILVHHATEDSDARKRAAGNLGWILGLNPGIPSTKALNAETGGRPWTAAAFVSNLNVPSARGMDAFMTPGTNIKTWLYSWEEGLRSVHREAWFVQPKENGFMTLLNGHMLWDGEWDYWNQGVHGWMSGETFLLHDGAFLKAAIAYEDAMNGQWSPLHAPFRQPQWKVTEVTFFDTTLDQRNQTGWGFAEINKTTFAHASRMSAELCSRFGFAGGRPTGHQDGERIGVLCVPLEGTRAVDVNQQLIDGTGVSTFRDINTVPWHEASRVATQLCAASLGGFFTGHQIDELRGIVCAGSNSAKKFTTTAANINMSWQDAARAATNFCLTQNYGGGFFDGASGVVCLRPGG